jgi:excinuclease ABC subunit C
LKPFNGGGLIKKYQPKFNVVWRDDKNYFFVAITKTERPYVFITHQKTANAEYIGPFVDGQALKKTLKF